MKKRLVVLALTSCALAGPGCDQLFITSAALNKDDEAQAGDCFTVPVSQPGAEAAPWQGAIP